MSKDLSLHSLRLFCDVVRHGSFSEVARRHGLPVSSVSRHITRLEERLGETLMVRNTRSLRLTDAGRAYHGTVREALEMLELAEEDASGGAEEPRGILRINAPVAFGRQHVAPHLAAFQARHPALEVELTLTDSFVDPVAEAVDVLLRIGTLPDSGLISRTLARQRHCLCASPAYLERQGIPQSPEDLRQHNCLIYKGTRGEMMWHFRGTAAQAGPERLTGNLRSNSAESLIEAALAGQGLVLFPDWLLYRHVASGALQEVLSDWQAAPEAGESAIHMLFPENRLRSSKVRSFIDYLSNRIGRVPYWETD